MYKLGVGLPVYLPIGHTAVELEAQDSLFDKISYLITKAHAGKHAGLLYWKQCFYCFNRSMVKPIN